MKCALRLAEPIQTPSRSNRAYRRIAAITTAALLAASCSSTTSTTPPAPAQTTEAVVAVDLTSERIQSELGSPPFEPVNWQRTVGPFTVVGDDQLPDPNQIALMTAATAELPPQLTVTPRALVRTSSFTGPVDGSGAHAVAVALGPDIYLLDPVFDLDGGTTRLDLAYALAHELAHIDQWFALDPAYVAAARAGEVPQIVLSDGSDAVEAFAAATGWEDTDPDPTAANWVLSGDGVASSAYGATGPVEDMADTLAWAAMGRTDWLDAAHLDWIETWSGVEAETFADGKPWSPAGSEEVLSAAPVYDEAQVETLLAANGTHAEPLYFQLPDSIDEPAAFAAQVTIRLNQRGLTGTLTETIDDRLPRYSGVFNRPDGTVFWVEFWDFRTADLAGGPSQPILTYVLVW